MSERMFESRSRQTPDRHLVERIYEFDDKQLTRHSLALVRMRERSQRRAERDFQDPRLKRIEELRAIGHTQALETLDMERRLVEIGKAIANGDEDRVAELDIYGFFHELDESSEQPAASA